MSLVGPIFVPFPPKMRTKLLHPRPPPIVERVSPLRTGEIKSVQHYRLGKWIPPMRQYRLGQCILPMSH